MTMNDDLPREYHERDLEEYRSAVNVTAPAHLFGQARVLQDIAEERLRQVEKWGPQSHPDGTSPDFAAERDDYRAYCDKMADLSPETDTWLNILREETFEAFAETDWPALRKELIQSAAVAVAWVEDGDARRA